MSNQPIGVFDSGVGGLSVLHALQHALPHESYVYLGDSARLPYGTKSPEIVTRYAAQAAGVLVDFGIKLLVVACNTASSVALPALQKAFYPLPVVGVIAPSAKLCEPHQFSRIAVLGTQVTVSQHAYKNAILELLPNANIFEHACPLLVTMAEEGWIEGKLTEDIILKSVEPVLQHFASQKPECWILGCTHFPVFEGVFQKLMGPQVHIMNTGQATAFAVREILTLESALAASDAVSSIRFLVTDGVERFKKIAPYFIPNHPLDQIELVTL